MEEFAQKILDQVKQSYSIISGKFSQTRNREWPIMIQLISKYLKPGDRALDIGCGNGRLYKTLNDREIDYLGVDNNPELIKAAEKTGGKFIINDILEIDFKQEFDAVLAFAVINHLPNRRLRLRALKNLFQSLRPGGYLLMTNWNFWRFSRKQKTIWRYKIFERIPAEKNLGFKDIITYFQDLAGRHPLYYHAFTLSELKRLLRLSGFEIVDDYYEKKGQKIWWGSADNLVLVARKEKQ